jgi:hypothetical protein
VGVSADGEHAVEEERSTGKNEFDGEEREGVRISVSKLFFCCYCEILRRGPWKFSGFRIRAFASVGEVANYSELK